MADFLLGIDYGTGGAKACIINTEGEVLGFAFREYPLIHKMPGWSEHDPNLYWEICCDLIQSAIKEGNIDPTEIRGIAVSSALPSLVMVDKENNPIHNAYNLMDRRATTEVAYLKDIVGEERLFQLTGNRLEDHPTIVNLLWEKNNRPDSFANIEKALTIDGFITLRLTNKASLNYSAGAFYGVAYNLRDLNFDQDVLDQIGIPREILPDLCRCESVVGEVTSDAAVQTGLVPGIPVAGGQVDCNAGYLGAGAVHEGDIQCNLGTVGNFGVVYTNVDFSFTPAGRMSINFPYTVRDTYITVPTTMTGGQSIRYLRDKFSQYEVEIERVLGVSSYDLLNLEAAKVPLGSDGLIILPYLMGERSPIWDAKARGVIFGLSLNHGKGHLVRAMMEGVAFAMYHSFSLLKEAGLKINLPLIMNEGGAVSVLWRQIIADVFNIPISFVERRTGAPYGDAILAGVATGILSDFGIAKDWANYVDPMQPDPQNHQRYMEFFELYKKLYEHTREDFQELARLRGQG